MADHFLVFPVREHIPLEQGLRHEDLSSFEEILVLVREHIPLEQGLRLMSLCFLAQEVDVREHIPLEQGLRRPP